MFVYVLFVFYYVVMLCVLVEVIGNYMKVYFVYEVGLFVLFGVLLGCGGVIIVVI